MARLFSLVCLLCAAGFAYAQRNQLWSNAALAARGMQPAEQRETST